MNPMQIMQMLQNAQNPMSLIQNMFGSNPQFQRVMQMVDGKTPAEMEQIAKNLCAQSGVDFSSAVGNMRRMGLNIPTDSSHAKIGK